MNQTYQHNYVQEILQRWDEPPADARLVGGLCVCALSYMTRIAYIPIGLNVTTNTNTCGYN